MQNRIKFLIPNVLTASNLICGVGAIVYSIKGWESIPLFLVLVGSLFDLLDGMAAKLLKTTSEFGKQFDTIADMVTFGLAPAIMAYLFYEKHFSANGMEFIPFFIFLHTLFAAIRLARFNAAKKQTISFSGLPSPAAGLFLASLPFLVKNGMSHYIFSSESLSLFIISAIFIVSVLMIVPIPMMSLKFQSTALIENFWKYILIFVIVISFIFFQFFSIPFLIIFYILLSLIRYWFDSNSKTQKNKTNEIPSRN